MSIKQVNLHIPYEINKGLMEEIYEHSGGVVRKVTNKQFVTFLDEVDCNDADEIKSKAVEVLKNKKWL